MKKNILFIGYGISSKRKEAVSKNTVTLSKQLTKLGYATQILNIGYAGEGIHFENSMLTSILNQHRIRKLIGDYIQQNKITHVIDVFVLPLASLLFVAPLKTQYPHVSFIKEIHNDYGASKQLHSESLIRLLANNKFEFNSVLNAYNRFFTRNLYLAKKYKFSYLPMIVYTSLVPRPKRKNTVSISYLGHPLRKKGIYEFPRVFSLLSDNIKKDVEFNFALSDIGDRLSVEELLQSSAQKYGIKINIEHEVKPANFFRNQDFYILPIHDQFGAVSTPNTVLEAMEAGAIPIVHDIPSLNGIVEHMKTGILLRSFRAEDIVDVLEDVVYDSNLQKKLRLAARSFVLSTFEEKNINLEIRKIVE